MNSILTLALGGLLAGTIVLVIKSWIIFNDVTMTHFGDAALVVGTLLSLALGAGLLHLMFRSERTHGTIEDSRLNPDDPA